jgi:hypothetical protein
MLRRMLAPETMRILQRCTGKVSVVINYGEQTSFLVTCAELAQEIDAILATVMRKLIHEEWLAFSTSFSDKNSGIIYMVRVTKCTLLCSYTQ